jgi:hypothetical protein
VPFRLGAATGDRGSPGAPNCRSALGRSALLIALAASARTGHPALVPCDSRGDLSAGEIELLIDGLSDDVSFDWALIHLSLRCNAPGDDVPPSPGTIGAAFEHFERLLDRNLVELARIEYVDPNQPPGTVAPVKHTSEPIADVRNRVEKACAAPADWGNWAFSCWLVNTDAGDAVARGALKDRS